MSTEKDRRRATDVRAFRRAVWRHYRAHGRHDLPWRRTRDPYKILVSEVMLQQTQVARVLAKYEEFIRAFPTVRALADAPLAEVLKVWNGLGYNRRGKYLHDAAQCIMTTFGGDFRSALAHPLPGVGPYTRAAVGIFAFNEPLTCLETNIRAAFIHHFFPGERKVHDRELVSYIEAAAEGQDPREWHWALMDYGTRVKRLHRNPTRRSHNYRMQPKFDGSLRQVRGDVLRLLATGSFGDLALAKALTYDGKKVREALRALQKDGLVVSERGSWRIA